MAYQVINLPPLLAVTTSAGGTTGGIGSLDDAERITLFMVSTANALTSGAVLQVSQFDPAIPIPVGLGSSMLSTGFHTLSSVAFVVGTTVSSGIAVVIDNVAWRGFRLGGLTSAVAGERIATVVKHISV